MLVSNQVPPAGLVVGAGLPQNSVTMTTLTLSAVTSLCGLRTSCQMKWAGGWPCDLPAHFLCPISRDLASISSFALVSHLTLTFDPPPAAGARACAGLPPHVHACSGPGTGSQRSRAGSVTGVQQKPACCANTIHHAGGAAFRRLRERRKRQHRMTPLPPSVLSFSSSPSSRDWTHGPCVCV